MRLRSSLAVALVVGLGVPARAADPLPRARPETVGLDPARLGRIRKVLERDVAEGRMPGAVVAIARRGKLAYFEAIGFLDREKKIPMRKDAIFSIASMTKPLTGVAALVPAGGTASRKPAAPGDPLGTDVCPARFCVPTGGRPVCEDTTSPPPR